MRAWGVSGAFRQGPGPEATGAGSGDSGGGPARLDNGAVCLTYLNESDDIMFIYCEAIVKSEEDTFWVTELICKAEDQFIYRSQFLDWARPLPFHQ